MEAGCTNVTDALKQGMLFHVKSILYDNFNIHSCFVLIFDYDYVNILCYSFVGTKPIHFAKIAYKNHKHSTNNP
jgi:hypothetical protein